MNKTVLTPENYTKVLIYYKDQRLFERLNVLGGPEKRVVVWDEETKEVRFANEEDAFANPFALPSDWVPLKLANSAS